MASPMSRLRILLPLLLFLAVGRPESASLTPVYRESIRVRSIPVPLADGDLRRVRVGALTLIGGWRLDSMSNQFGGWSALHVEGDRVISIGDSGSVLRFRLGRFGHISDARIDPVPADCGINIDKHSRDTESLADGGGGEWLVGFEWRNAICRITPDFKRAVRWRAPGEMTRWPTSRGAEAIVRLQDGRTLVMAEGVPWGEKQRPMLLFDGDPTAANAHATPMLYVPPDGYSPTDAAQLPDGRILVMNRQFSVFGLFTDVLTSIDSSQFASGSVVIGKPLAWFDGPVLHDNFEGLSVTLENGQPMIWVISDDNFMSWQRTYLLKFAIDPLPPGVRPRPVSRP